jgi:hypothetical protein
MSTQVKKTKDVKIDDLIKVASEVEKSIAKGVKPAKVEKYQPKRR